MNPIEVGWEGVGLVLWFKTRGEGSGSREYDNENSNAMPVRESIAY
jgi:hypothetical protein